MSETEYVNAQPQETAAQAEERRRKTASWKFDLLETVAADSLCNGADVEIILAYIRYMDEPAGRAYRSNIQLRAATGLSEPTIAKRRENLQRLGYMAADGQTSHGVTWYKIKNARENLVLDHVAISGAALRRADAIRKEEDRRKQKLAPMPIPQETFTPPSTLPQETLGTGQKKLMTTTYRNHVESLGTEEREPIKVSTALSYVEIEVDRHLPYPVPESDDDAAEFVMTMLEGQPPRVVLTLFDVIRDQLPTGTFTPAKLDALLGRAA